MPSDSALDRVARLLELIPFLANQESDVAEIASRLQVSVEDLERDLQIAFLCGLPGYTPDLLIDLHLEDGRAFVTEPQVLGKPRRLTSSEASALLLGLAIIEGSFATSDVIHKSVTSLREKLELTEISISPVTEVDPTHQSKMAIVEESLEQSSRISFTYVDSLGIVTSGRLLTPWEVVVRGGRSLVRGFDHGHQEVREFFLSSMSDIELVEGVPRLQREVGFDSGSNGADPEEATLVFEDLPLWWIRRYSPFIDRWEAKGRETTVVVRYWRREWLLRALISVVDHLEKVDAVGLPQQAVKERLLSYLSGSAPSFE